MSHTCNYFMQLKLVLDVSWQSLLSLAWCCTSYTVRYNNISTTEYAMKCLMCMFPGICTCEDFACPYKACVARTMSCKDGEDCSVTCSGEGSCVHATVNCPVNGRCIVECSWTAACLHFVVNAAPNTTSTITLNALHAAYGTGITLNGADGAILNVHCSASFACFGSTIDARSSSALSVFGCNTFYACYEMNIWCPPNIGGDKQCLLPGIDPLYTVYTPFC